MSGLTAQQLRDRFPKMPEKTVQMNAIDGAAGFNRKNGFEKGHAEMRSNPLPAYVTAPTDSMRALKGSSAAIESPKSRRVRQAQEKKMNKTESDFLIHLRTLHLSSAKIRFNEVRFELANGLHFKPDFTVDLLQAYEAKGPWASRDAFPRLKMAARLFPEITWFLATRSKRTVWDIQQILP